MTIAVSTNDPTVNKPVTFEMTDSSGAHVELTVSIEGLPPIAHAFAFNEGTITTRVPMKAGKYKCTFVIQAYKYKALNGMYESRLTVNGQAAADAKGAIPDGRTNDVGFGDFTLTVA